MTILKLVLYIVLGMFVYLLATRKYTNPYKLIFVFGKKGSGKSTLLQKLTNRYLKKGWTVYSTEVKDHLQRPKTEEGEGTASFDNEKTPPVEPPLPSSPKGEGRMAPFRRGRFLSEAQFIDPTKIFEYTFPENTCILIDEVSLIWDNRDFKRMDKRVIEWFRYQRHHRCRVYLFSQNFDVDAKIRSLADEMFLVEKFARVFVIAKRIIRKPVVVHPGPETPARIDEDLIVDGPLMALFGGREYCFIPYWSRKFNSFTTDYKRKGVLEDIQD